MGEFGKVSERKVSEFKGLQTQGRLSFVDETFTIAIRKRQESHENSEKNYEYTLHKMLHPFNARLFKPQRLVSLTYDEAERRCVRTWWRFDHKLNLACFRPLEELALVVKEPEAFREHVRDFGHFHE